MFNLFMNSLHIFSAYIYIGATQGHNGIQMF